MTDTDTLVLKVIRAYYRENGKYPPRVEVTEELFAKMQYRAFSFPVSKSPENTIALMSYCLSSDTPAPAYGVTRVPVTLVGDYVMAKDKQDLSWVGAYK